MEPQGLPSPPDGVEIVAWPRGHALRTALARAGVPRLLVLDPDQAPPDDLAFDEDWIRAPYVEEDLQARARRIVDVVRIQSAQESWLDDERVLHRGGRTVVLTPSEAAVADELLSHQGVVVSRRALEQRLWPDGTPPSDRAVDAIVYRLRRRCEQLGLAIRAARGRGFVLSGGAGSSGATAPPEAQRRTG